MNMLCRSAVQDIILNHIYEFSIFTCDAQQYSTQRHPSTYPCLLQELEHIIWRKSFIYMWIPFEYII